MEISSAPTVSVVMPTYNRADLLPKTIASILSQDFDDFELLIVDDGSTDNTAALIKEFQDKNCFTLKYYSQQNKGPGAARNLGMKNASGDFFIFIDSLLCKADILAITFALFNKFCA